MKAGGRRVGVQERRSGTDGDGVEQRGADRPSEVLTIAEATSASVWDAPIVAMLRAVPNTVPAPRPVMISPGTIPVSYDVDRLIWVRIRTPPPRSIPATIRTRGPPWAAAPPSTRSRPVSGRRMGRKARPDLTGL